MTPSARLSSVLELLETIMSTAGPAEHTIRGYFKTRRYAGSKDRRWVTEFVYGLFRRLGEVDWIVAELKLPATSRSRALVALLYLDDISFEEVQSTYLSGSYATDPLSEDESTALKGLETLTVDPMAKENFPKWVSAEIHRQYGDQAAAILTSYLDRAPLTLRVNRLRSDREETVRLLREDDLEIEPTTLSPLGIIVKGRVNLNNHPVMERGLVEIQDEAAQISSLLAQTEPGMQVVDFCAGAGGKSLAMAAEMTNTGQIYGFDVDGRRMKDMTIRSRRSGVHILESHQLYEDERDDEIFDRLGDSVHRVFVDAPCSGSGTWRRQPDQKWFLSEERLGELVELQMKILNRAAPLVAPGGRLIYATCSILAQENSDQITAFLETHTEFSLLPVSDIWEGAGLDGAWTDTMLQLTPDRIGTDGFFTAVLHRKG